MLKMKSNLKNFYSSRMAPWAIANLYSSKYYRGKKTKNLPIDGNLPKATTFEWFQEWSPYTGLTVSYTSKIIILSLKVEKNP